MKLYGRDKEAKKLREAIHDESCRWVWITGDRGVGKSSFLLQVTKTVKAEASGLFWMETELQKENASLSSLYSGLLQLLEQVKLNPECCKALSKSPNLGILKSWLPGIEDAIDYGLSQQENVTETTSVSTSSSSDDDIAKRTEASISLPPNQQIQIAVKLALQEVQQHMKIIWLIDNLHQTVIRNYLSSLLAAVENLTIIVTAESKEALEDTVDSSCCEIPLGNLSLDDVSCIVPDLTQARRLWALSKGSPSLLVALTRPGIDLDSFPEDRPTSLEDVWQKQIHQASPELAKFLRIASCLQSLDEQGLSLLMSDGEAEVMTVKPCLQTAKQAGLLVEKDSSKWSFTHPDLKKMIYHLFVQEEVDRTTTAKAIPRIKSRLHYQIGKRLWKLQQSTNQQTGLLREVVHQLWLGKEHLCQDEEYLKVASLCLRLGRCVARNKSYLESSRYLQHGLEVLSCHPDKGRSAWRDDYNLCLLLHSTAAEVHYCCSEFDRVPDLVDAVVANARNYNDTLDIRQAYIYVLSSQGKHDEAIEMGIETMCHLNEPLPKRPTYFHVLAALARTKWLLRGRSDESILRLPTITDPTKFAAMKITGLIMLATYQARPMLVPILVAKCIRLTILYGQCEISTAMFGVYGMLLAAIASDVDNGYRYGQLSLKMYEQKPNKAFLGRVYTSVYGCISPYKDHIATTCGPLMEAYRCGLTTGDYEMAINATVMCFGNQLDSKNLFQQEIDLRAIIVQMTTMGQTSSMWFFRLFLQTVENFLGKAHGHPSIFKGDTIDVDKDLTPQMERQEPLIYLWMKFYCMLVAYCFGDYNLAAKFSVGLHKLRGNKIASNAVSVVGLLFYEGISVLASSQGRRRVFYVRRLLHKVKYYTQHSPMNFLGKLHFLQAELAAASGKHASVVSEFSSAIAFSREGGFILQEALANERAGRYCQDRKDYEKATAYLHEALKLYRQFGAVAKVDLLRAEMPDVFQDEGASTIPATKDTKTSLP